MDININKLKRLDCEIVENHRSLSAFKTGGRIGVVIYPLTIKCMVDILNFFHNEHKDCVIIGNGSNVLFPDSKFDKVVVCTKKLANIKVEGQEIYASCGTLLSSLHWTCRENGLGGMEELVGIPASLGGAVVMNAGAFGREIKDVIECVDIWQDGRVKSLLVEDIPWTYRDWNMGSCVVLGAKLRLGQSTMLEVASRQKYFENKRQKTQPTGISLGSVFKRVNDVSAGYYIERAGLKGYQIGGAVVSEKHAGFVINVGGAKSKDFVKLSQIIKERVDKLYGISLEYEVHIL